MPGTTTAGLRYPLPTEAPDGPGALSNLAADVDQTFRIGGAEYCTNLAAIQTIPTARTYKGKLAYAADTDAIYRYNGTAWTLYSWLAIPFATYGALQNGALTDTSGTFEASISAGVLTLNYSIAKASAASGVSYLQLFPGFRPAAVVDHYATAYAPTSGLAAMKLSSDGSLVMFFPVGVSGAITAIRGTVSFRPAN